MGSLLLLEALRPNRTDGDEEDMADGTGVKSPVDEVDTGILYWVERASNCSSIYKDNGLFSIVSLDSSEE